MPFARPHCVTVFFSRMRNVHSTQKEHFSCMINYVFAHHHTLIIISCMRGEKKFERMDKLGEPLFVN